MPNAQGDTGEVQYVPQEDELVLLVDWPSSEAAAPELPRPSRELDVEVDVEPALPDWRG